MGRGLFLLLISNLIGVIMSPGILMATDVVIFDEPDFGIIKTAVASRATEDESVVQTASSGDKTRSEMYGSTDEINVMNLGSVSGGDEVEADVGYGQMASSVTTASYSAAASYVAPVNYGNSISVAGRTLEIVDVNDVTLDAGYHVNRYGGKFLYGHNSAAVFGGLVNMGVGSVFSVNNGGAVTNYQVSRVVVFEKNNGKLQLNGKGSYMNAVAAATYNGEQHSLTLMTCYGQVYGGGDASHRLVLFADAI